MPPSPTDSVGPASSRPLAPEFDDPPPPPPPAYHPLAYEEGTTSEQEASFYLVAPPPEREPSPPSVDPHRRRSTDDHILLFSGHEGYGSAGTPSEDDGEYESEDSASYESEDLVREQLVGPRGSDSGADDSARAFDPSAARDEGPDAETYGDESDQGDSILFEDGDDDDESDIDGAPVELESVQPGQFEHERDPRHEGSDAEPSRKRRRLSPPDSPQPWQSPAGMNDFEEGEIPDDEPLERSPSAVDLGDFSPVFSFFQQERSRLSSAAQPARLETSTPVRRPSSVPNRLVPTPPGVDSSPLLVSRVDGTDRDSSVFATRPAASTSSPRPPLTSLGPIPFPSYSRSDYDGSDVPSSPVFNLPVAQPLAASASHPARGALPPHLRPRQSAGSASDADEADLDGDTTMDMDMSFDDLPADLVGDPTRRVKGPISILQRPLPLEKASYQRRIVQPLDLHPATPKAGPAVKPMKLSYVPSPIQPGQPAPSFAPVPLIQAANLLADPSFDGCSHLRTKPPLKRALKKKDRPKSMYERPDTGVPLPPNVYKNNLSNAERLAYNRRVAGMPAPAPAPAVAPSRPQQSKAPGALPLSRDEKLASLPAKLVAAFPQLSLDEAASYRLFVPSAALAPPAKGTKPPSESSLFGFWPAPPSLSSGKNVYPAPPVVEPDPADAQRARVDIFIDHSNVLYSFLNWARARPEATILNYVNPGKAKVNKTVTIGGRKARIDYDIFFALLERGRKVGKRVLVGSSPLWQGLEPAVEWVRFCSVWSDSRGLTLVDL